MARITLPDATVRYSSAELLHRLGIVVTARGSTPSTLSSPAVGGGSPSVLRVCGNDERTAHLTSLAGSFLGRGHSMEDTKQICLDWNARNTPPLPIDKVEETVESMERTHARNHPAGAKPTGPITPLFDLQLARIGPMLSSQPPQRRWLLRDFLPYGKVGAIVAPGGTGKSQLALQLGFSVATAEKFAGTWDVDEQGSALLLFAEDDTEEIHVRLRRITQSIATFDPAMAKLAESRLFVRSLVGENNLMTDGKTKTGVEATDFVPRLLEVTKQISDLKLIVIDPASRFRGGEENSAEDTTRFIEQVERLCQATGATVLVLHHANKRSQTEGTQDQGSSRGSSAFADGVRWLMTLSTMTKAQAQSYAIPDVDRRKYLIASLAKSNYGALTADVVLWRGADGVLRDSTVGQATMSPEKLLVTLILQEGLAGRTYSATAFEDQFGGAKGAFKIGKVKLRKLIKDSIAAGYVTKATGQVGTLQLGTVTPP
jgi:hypothetical protein